jgi:hypothetical protein
MAAVKNESRASAAVSNYFKMKIFTTRLLAGRKGTKSMQNPDSFPYIYGRI